VVILTFLELIFQPTLKKILVISSVNKTMQNPIQSFYNWYRQTLRHPKYRWLIIGATLLYLLSPIDISPDFIPMVGWIDDGIIATLLVSELSSLILERLNRRKDTVANSEEVVEVSAEAVRDGQI
jgi:uncharacterized membrane protein YkvA (DUF1232 family)